LGALLIVVLALYWLPLGPEQGRTRNVLFVGVLIAALLGIFSLFRLLYTRMLRWCLDHKLLFLALPIIVTTLGASIWLGWDRLFGWLPERVRQQTAYVRVARLFPGMEKEFMPRLDEGSFISMPTTMPHASIGEAIDMLSKLDRAIGSLPEVEEAVGKAGRAESPLDPAPVSMFEILINYRPPYLLDEKGHRQTFRFDPDRTDLFRDRDGLPIAAPDGKPYHVAGQFMRDENNRLIPDRGGQPFRLWRPALDPALNSGRDAWPGIQSPDDIWNEIVRVSRIPGVTSSPKLQPIETRIVMLQSGMRAPMGVKVRGPDSATIEKVSLEIERILKQIPAVRADTVLADRIVGKPYLEIDIDRTAIARYGLQIQDVQRIIQTAIGGSMVSMTVEGRERYPIRIRYPRERRDSPDALERILVPTPAGHPVPLGQLATIRYVRGPQVLKSEDTFQVGYVTFDKQPHLGEVDVVEQCQAVLRERIASGDLHIPPGVSYTFAGSYQNQVRAARTLAVIVPFTLLIIFMILYLQFHAIAPTLMVFSGIFVAWSGGFLMLWLYGQPWFLSGELFGIPLQQLFQVQRYNLSVAVWVGFLALFGIATDDGVLMGTVLTQEFKRRKPSNIREIREATIAAAALRIRPALLTSATTILALLPVLTSTGRGSDIMVPMAIPTFGGMLIALLTVFVVPVLFCLHREHRRQ
jgi:Cu(I)/Ag(I) efflux system membrane protein CusA/SilA